MDVQQHLILVIDAQATLFIDLHRFLAVLDRQLEGKEGLVRRDRSLGVGTDVQLCPQRRNAGGISHRDHLWQAARRMLEAGLWHEDLRVHGKARGHAGEVVIQGGFFQHDVTGGQHRDRERLGCFQAAVADRLALERHPQHVLRAQGVARDRRFDALLFPIGHQLLRANQVVVEEQRGHRRGVRGAGCGRHIDDCLDRQATVIGHTAQGERGAPVGLGQYVDGAGIAAQARQGHATVGAQRQLCFADRQLAAAGQGVPG
ncbi:hypothetical protein D3C84_643630 [compost metagenome]